MKACSSKCVKFHPLNPRGRGSKASPSRSSAGRRVGERKRLRHHCLPHCDCMSCGPTPSLISPPASPYLSEYVSDVLGEEEDDDESVDFVLEGPSPVKPSSQFREEKTPLALRLSEEEAAARVVKAGIEVKEKTEEVEKLKKELLSAQEQVRHLEEFTAGQANNTAKLENELKELRATSVAKYDEWDAERKKMELRMVEYEAEEDRVLKELLTAAGLDPANTHYRTDAKARLDAQIVLARRARQEQINASELTVSARRCILGRFTDSPGTLVTVDTSVSTSTTTTSGGDFTISFLFCSFRHSTPKRAVTSENREKKSMTVEVVASNAACYGSNHKLTLSNRLASDIVGGHRVLVLDGFLYYIDPVSVTTATHFLEYHLVDEDGFAPRWADDIKVPKPGAKEVVSLEKERLEQLERREMMGKGLIESTNDDVGYAWDSPNYWRHSKAYGDAGVRWMDEMRVEYKGAPFRKSGQMW